MIKITPDQFKKRRLLNGGRRFLHAALVTCALVSFDAAAQEKGKSERAPEREVRGGLQGAGGNVKRDASRNADDDIKMLLALEQSHALPEGMTESRREKLKEICQLVRDGNLDDARIAWEQMLKSFSKPIKPEQHELFARNLLHELMAHESAELARVIKLLFANMLAISEIETHSQRIRSKAKGVEPDATQTVDIPEIEIQPDGTLKTQKVTIPDLTAAQIEAVALELDEKINELKTREAELRQTARDAVESNEPQILRIEIAAAMLEQTAQAIIKKSE